MYYIGIDGGGTKTSFTIINEEGIQIDHLITGTSHYMQIGFDGVLNLLNESMEKILNKNNIKRDEIKAAFIGLPGYGEVKDVKIKLDEIVKTVFNDIAFKVGNDVEVGLSASLAGNYGVNIVSGTGSIALGKDSSGRYVRCGGWGDYIGDEGSAHWIGKKALEVFSKESDFRLEKGDLYKNIKEVLGLVDDFEIIDYVTNKISKDRTKVAEFSKICYESALNKDENSIKIFKDAAYELSLLVKMIINKLDFEGEILVSYSGGVFKCGDMILNPLKEQLKEYNIKLIEPILMPSQGACLLAYSMVNDNISDDFITNLQNELAITRDS